MFRKHLFATLASLCVAGLSAQSFWPSQYGFIDDCRYILHEEDQTAELCATNVWNDITNKIIKKSIDVNGVQYSVNAITSQYGQGALACRSFKNNMFIVPEWIKTIGNDAFKYSRFEKVTIGSGVETIGDNAFEQCNSLKEIDFATCINLSSIGKHAFEGVGSGNNNSCSIKSIFIPIGMTEIKDCAFRSAHIESIHFLQNDEESNLEVSGLAFAESNVQTIEINCKSIGNSAFRKCHSLKKLIIGKDVTAIGDSAFFDTQSLATIIVGRNTPPVCGKDAFYGAGYAHGGGFNGSQIEYHGYCSDAYGNKTYMGSDEAFGMYANELHYVKVFLAVVDYDSSYPMFKNSRVKFTDCYNSTVFNYQGWEKDRTNNFFIEFIPSPDGNNVNAEPDRNTLNNFGQDGLQQRNANFYYAPMPMTDVKTDSDISDPSLLDLVFSNPTTCIDDSSALNAPRIYASHGAIIIDAAEDALAHVFSISGAEVYAGHSKSIAVNPGLYIVRVNGSSAKVIVK